MTSNSGGLSEPTYNLQDGYSVEPVSDTTVLVCSEFLVHAELAPWQTKEITERVSSFMFANNFYPYGIQFRSWEHVEHDGRIYPYSAIQIRGQWGWLTAIEKPIVVVVGSVTQRAVRVSHTYDDD